MSMRIQERLTETPMVSSVASSYPESLTLVQGKDLISATYRNHAFEAPQGRKLWTSSAPFPTTYADYGKRPGAEVGHQNCDSHHTNFIIAGRNVN